MSVLSGAKEDGRDIPAEAPAGAKARRQEAVTYGESDGMEREVSRNRAGEPGRGQAMGGYVG